MLELFVVAVGEGRKKKPASWLVVPPNIGLQSIDVVGKVVKKIRSAEKKA